MGTKQYVIKRGKMELKIEYTTKEDWEQTFKDQGITWEYVKKFQKQSKIDEFERAGPDDSIKLIVPPTECKLLQKLTTPAIPSIKKSIVTFPVGSYLCEDERFSEYVNSVYAGQLYRDGQCAHFFNVYSFFGCSESYSVMKQYIIMDRLHGSLKGNKYCLALKNYKNNKYSVEDLDSFYVQTMFAVASYQQKYKLSHNDLHLDNVFVECIDSKSSTMFNNQMLHDADWFHYTVGKKNIYIKATSGIVKIGDWGFSIKYSVPIVGDKYAVENGYDGWMPNQFFAQYDALVFTWWTLLELVHYANDTSLMVDDCTFYVSGA